MKIKHIRLYKKIELPFGQLKDVVDGKGGITIVSVPTSSIDDWIIYNYTLALCSPKDNFNKKYGVMIAHERLKDPNTKLRGTIFTQKFHTGHLLKSYLLSDIIHKVELPKWAYEAIIKELQKEWY